MNYFFSRNYQGYIYTIDMVRLKTYIDSRTVIKICNELNAQNFKFWSNHGFGKFPHNWKVDSLWLGLGAKTVNTDNNKIIFCIEFNPNKATETDWFWFYYFAHSYDFTVTRIDLAIDIPKNINDILFLNLNKKTYSVFFNDFNDKTYYFGKSDGHTKIYNKKIESNLTFELTRYEVTKELTYNLHNPSFEPLNFNFLEIAYQPYLSSDYDSTTQAVLHALNCGFPYKNLSRHYKEIIKKDFFGAYELNNDFANEVLKQFLERLVPGISNKPGTM